MQLKFYRLFVLCLLSILCFDGRGQSLDLNVYYSCEACIYNISERSLFFDDGGESGPVSPKKQSTTYRTTESKYGYELSMYFTKIDIPKGSVLHITYGDIGSEEKEVLDLTEIRKIANIKAQEITIEYFPIQNSEDYSGWSGKIDVKKSKTTINQSTSQQESDCPYAIPLCSNNTAVALGGLYSDLGSIADEDGTCYGNLGDGGSGWYSFSPLTSGPLDFRITPQGSTDYDFVLWDITNGCESGKRSQVSCNYSLYTGQTGLSASLCGINEGSCTDDCTSQSKPADCTRFNNRVNVTVGRKYAVCINFYSGSNDGFVIKFQNESGSVAINDNTPPTLTSALTPNCNNASSFNIKFSEWIDCSTLQDVDLTIPGRTVTITSNNCAYNRTNNITINVTPALTAGSYVLTGQNILDLCGNNMNSSFNIVIGTQPNPSITPPVPVCKNPTPSGSTVNSPNNQVLTASGGTTYLWSTGATTASVTVNQAATRTYTVTAYNGACYASASTTVIVQQANPVSLGPDKYYCGTPVTITASPVVAGYTYQFYRGANLTSNGTLVQSGTSPSLTVSPASNTTYRVIVTDLKGCKAQDDIIVKVSSTTGTAVITVPGTNFCPNANPVLLTASPEGGTFSGPGIVGDYFYPTIAGVGLHAINYTVINACGTFNASKNIRVINGTLPNLGLNPTYCVTSPDVVLSPTPKCGTYFGPGIITSGTCNLALTSYSTFPVFSPSAAGVGTHVITYSGIGCGNSFTVNVLDVTGIPSIAGLNGPYCTTEPPVTLTGIPSGGVFSGPGISGNVFTPSTAGIGNHPIKYKITTCSGFDSSIVLVQVVSSAAAATISYSGSPYCQSITSTQNVTLMGTSGGTFSALPAGLSINSSTGAISPISSTAGNYIVSYSIPGSGSCPGYITTAPVTITASSIPNFNTIAPFCSGAAAPLLPGTSINGISGSWSPNLINNTSNGSYIFTPSSGFCANQVTINTTVNPTVNPTFTPIPSLCTGDLAPILPGSSIEGIAGTWSPSIVSNTNSGTYVFTPNAGQCAVNSSLLVTVNAAGIAPTFSINPTICKGAVAPVLPSISSNGISGNWSPSVVNNLNNGSYLFTPNSGQCAQNLSININVLDAFAVTVPAQICTGQTYTLPDGSTVSTAGNYPVTLTAKNGCDSVVTTNLTIVTSLATSIKDTICQGTTYTLPDGSTVNTVGSYPVTLISAAGCDSIVTINLNVNPIFNVTVPAVTCQGSPYTLPDGTTVTAAGNYPVTLTSLSGCDSVVTIKLTVNPTYNTTVSDTICRGESYNLPDGSSVTASGSYPVLLKSITNCDSLVLTNLKVLPVFAVTVPAQICTGQTYTLPDGSMVSSAGNYPVTLTAKNGCDSMVTTNLTIVTSLTTSIKDTICQGATYTLPDGSTVNTVGSYPVTLISAAGCDSIVTINLNVVNALSSTIASNICNGDSYTLPDGSKVSTAGIYTVTLVSNSGCDSIVKVDLKVNPVSITSASASFCSGRFYTLPDGSSVNNAGVYSVVLTNANGCDSTVTINLSISPPINKTVSAQICNGTSFTLPDGNKVNTAGTYPVTLTASNGCDSIITTNLSIVGTLTSNVSVQICTGQSYTLPDGVIVNNSGTYISKITSSGGCDSIISTQLNVAGTLTSSVDVNICSGKTYTLPNGSIVGTSGTYTTKLLSSGGCDSVVTINLNVINTFTTFVNTSICNGQTYTLPDGSTVSANGSYPIMLTSSAGCDSIVLVNLKVVNTISSTVSAQICSGNFYTLPDGIKVSTSGSYSSKILSSGGCDSIITTNLSVINSIVQSVSAKICSGLSYTLPDGLVVETTGNYTSKFLSASGCDSIINTNLIVLNKISFAVNAKICTGQNYILPDGKSVSSAGNYQVTINSSVGCDSIVNVLLEVNEYPAFTLGPDTTICSGTSIIISVNQDPGSSYLWQDGSRSSSITVSDPGLIYLTVTNECGSKTDTIEVIFDECIVCGVYAPNAFSPNGDGINDIFTPIFTCNQLEPYLFRIYNRWNQMVFETDVPGIGWDSYFNGVIQPTDSYIYYISYFDINANKTKVQKGSVTLIR